MPRKSIHTVTATATAKRPRGRPKKQPIVERVVETMTMSDIEVAKVPTPEPTPRSRGRPRKTTQTNKPKRVCKVKQSAPSSPVQVIDDSKMSDKMSDDGPFGPTGCSRDALLNVIDKNDEHTTETMYDMFIHIYSIMKLYPPSKNENKFVYGKLCEYALTTALNTIGCKTVLLDDNHATGSSYKNDISCEIATGIHKSVTRQYSIKTTKSGGDIVIINKNHSETHTVDDIRFVVIHIKKQRIYVFSHDATLEPFVKRTSSQICYKSSIYRHLDQLQSYYKFPVDAEQFTQIETTASECIVPDDYYGLLYNRVASSASELKKKVGKRCPK